MTTALQRALRQISFGTITLVDDTQALQQVQIKESVLGPDGAPQYADSVPVLGQFGLAANPPIGSKVLRLRLAGSHTLSMAVATAWEAARPKNLSPGDTQLYDVRGQGLALTAAGATVQGKGGAFSVSGMSAVSLGAPTTVQGAMAATGPVQSGAAVTAAGDVTAGAGAASLLAVAAAIIGLLGASSAQASAITTLQGQATEAGATSTALGTAQTAITANATAISQAQTALANAEAQTAAVLAEVASINVQIADLTKVVNDPAAQAASLLASQTAQAASEAARDAAQTAATQASASVTGAQSAAAQALAAATAADGSATTAAGSASFASSQATAASQSATASEGWATAAQNSAGAASVSEGQAATSAGDAESAATTAMTQAVLANGSAQAASESATDAAASQDGASESASSAQTSATAAQTSAGQAGTSAGQASTSETSAQGSADTAGTFASDAAGSASAAAGSASASNSSATVATTSASAAGVSATTAQSFAQQAEVQAGDSANSASTASSSAAVATAQAAAAQSSATLSASVGIGSLNQNPTFSSYSDPNGIPDDWSNWIAGSAGSAFSPGKYGPFAYNLTSTAGQDAGIFIGVSNVQPQWLVLEADILLNSGTLAGAGVGFYGATEVLNLIFSTDKDTNGVVNGAGGQNFYTFRKLVQKTAPDATVTLYAFTAYSGIGDVSESREIIWYRCDVRPATDGEIAGSIALGLANTNSATISSFQTAQDSDNTSFTEQLTVLNSTIFNSASGSLQSQITDNLSTQATQNSTFASQVTTLQAQVSINPNLCPNGSFANGFADWNAAAGATYYDDPNFGRLAYVPNWTGGTAVPWVSESINVSPGAQLTLSGNIQVADSSGNVYPSYLDRIYFDAAGTQIFDGNQTDVEHTLSPTVPSYIFSEITPAGAVTLQIRAVYGPPAGTPCFLYLQRVKLEAGPNFTGWSDDASTNLLTAAVTTTSATVATLAGQLYATYTLTATAGSVITGVQLISASGPMGVSAVIFQAENFIIKSASASAGVNPFAFNSTTGTLSLQNVVVATLSALSADLGEITAGLIVFNNGSTMKVIGDPPFGTTNQFVEWFGPSMAVSLCSESNAISYSRIDGSAYFKGAIKAGDLSNSVTGTDTSATAQTSIGPFGTNGGSITIALSYSYSHDAERTAHTATVTGTQSATVTAYLTGTAGVEAEIGSWTVNGTSSVDRGDIGDGGPDSVFTGMSGAWTYTDNSGGVGNKSVRLAVTSRSDFTIGGTVFGGQADSVSQGLSIVTSEG